MIILRTSKYLKLCTVHYALGTLLLFALCSLSTSCDVHQFPEIVQVPDDPSNPDDPQKPDDPSKPDDPQKPDPEDPDEPDEPLPELPDEDKEVSFKLIYNTDFYLWEHNYDPLLAKIEEIYPDNDIYPGYPGTSAKYSNIMESGLVDIHVKAYLTTNNSTPVAEKTVTIPADGSVYDTEIGITLPVDNEYNVAIWSHVREHEEAGLFYNPADFRKVGLVKDNYKGNTDYRDGFSGKVAVSTNEDSQTSYSIEMTRPMAKFELVTIDLSEFLDRETTRRSLATRASADEYHVKVTFPSYYPDSYNVLTDALSDAHSGYNFWTNMTVTGESEASLGFEYVMINSSESEAVMAQVDIYDPSYNRVAGSQVLTIPLRRDHHTYLRGAFLQDEGSGGIGIDPGFAGDHNITM